MAKKRTRSSTAQVRGVKRYHGFLRAAKKRFEFLDHKGAQELYQKIKTRYGRATKATLSNHPRIAKREAENAAQVVLRKRVRRLRKQAPGAHGLIGGEGLTKESRQHVGWEEFIDQYDLEDYDYIEYDSSADYEKKTER